MGLIALAALVFVVLVAWSNHRTRAIDLAGLTPEEAAEERTSEEAKRAEREVKRMVRRRPISIAKRLLLIVAVPLALIGFAYVFVSAMLIYSLVTGDPYPSFMADYDPPRLYADLERSFDQFITRRFPVGSNAQDAIAKIRRQGFRVDASREGLYRFTWDRHAGPCGEHYSIVLRQNSDSTIAEISGRVQTHCL
jgi:hypothetical protein